MEKWSEVNAQGVTGPGRYVQIRCFTKSVGSVMAREQLDLWEQVEIPQVSFCVKDLGDPAKCRRMFPRAKPQQLLCVKNLVSNGWNQTHAMRDAGYKSYNTGMFSKAANGRDYCPVELAIVKSLAKHDPDNGWWISEMLDAPRGTTLDVLLYTYQKLLTPDLGFKALCEVANIDVSKSDNRAHNIEYGITHQKLLAKKRAEMENLQATFEWKVKKLVELVELCTPSTAESHKDTNPGSTISAISELNKMQGHYAPDRSVTASLNIEGDPEIECVRETMEEIFLQWEKDF